MNRLIRLVSLVFLGSVAFNLSGCAPPTDPAENLKWHIRRGTDANIGATIIVYDVAEMYPLSADKGMVGWEKAAIKVNAEDVYVCIKKPASPETPFSAILTVKPNVTEYYMQKNKEEAEKTRTVAEVISDDPIKIDVVFKDGQWYVDSVDANYEDPQKRILFPVRKVPACMRAVLVTSLDLREK